MVENTSVSLTVVASCTGMPSAFRALVVEKRRNQIRDEPTELEKDCTHTDEDSAGASCRGDPCCQAISTQGGVR